MSIVCSCIILLDMLVMVLVSVAFLTLLERKILSYIQLRKGPNKVGFIGLLQPFSDAIKLFSKETSLILKSNYLFYLFSPVLSMLLMMMLWNFTPVMSKLGSMKFSIVIILCFMSMGVYSMMVAGWSSNSLYSLIGSLRSIAQTVSYEVSLILILLVVIILNESFNLYNYLNYQNYFWNLFFLFPIGLIFYVSCLAELNRTPFDFAEGESELVSGFNTEYMSGSFALIFIAEYGMIMFLMYFFSLLFLGGNFYFFFFYILYLFMLFLVIWIRGAYPRFRYDNLMYLTWKSFLPVSLNYLIFVFGFKCWVSFLLL